VASVTPATEPAVRPAPVEGTEVSRFAVHRGDSGVGRVLGSLEQGQREVDKLIEAGLSGKEFTNSELLLLQARMYRFTQEVELTSKVVEKGAGGIKETVRTQV